MYCNKAAKKLLFHVLYPMENLRDIIGKLQRKSQSVLCTVYVIVSTHERVCVNNDFSLKKAILSGIFNMDFFTCGGREKALVLYSLKIGFL